jgi:hypothetical protein
MKKKLLVLLLTVAATMMPNLASATALQVIFECGCNLYDVDTGQGPGYTQCEYFSNGVVAPVSDSGSYVEC